MELHKKSLKRIESVDGWLLLWIEYLFKFLEFTFEFEIHFDMDLAFRRFN